MKDQNTIVTGKHGSIVDFANVQASTIMFDDIVERISARYDGGIYG